MKRREAISRVALLMGGALSAPTMLAFLEGCKSANETSTGISFPFSQDRQALVSEVAEIIIPKTDTPGAKDAKVGEFIEKMLKDCYAEKDQSSFNEGMKELEKRDFMKASPAEQTKILKEMETAARTESAKAGEEKKKYTEAGKEYTDAGVPFFQLVKELTLLGYFTSEAGATQALEYVAVPGRYDGCIDLKPGQKAWAM
ncbi:gluconate 2-dehydrogenase subunit 3 family protein [Dyadobacter sediminis]|uniref:Gluconate 2-dehydrogenase subunit 3 family protein n=1 Tax=Dyadobacter sediminis TaxID=1493691 RepID=A0A5R9KIA9_9BACT|nr:gluconate 2-dehydrogenase subunit 3 family protein [Dyadobacter sediminis]TLU95935.1 gluconate 2-dehydrogenase subunit 3 family protein [Dyadobacter sediminis]GGB77868.1 twin-arginine translocation pathway signal protein [Dyadobacter sediminis]